MTLLQLVLFLLVFICSMESFGSEFASKSNAVDRFLEKQVRKFKVDYHRILEKERVRRKRDAGLMLSMTVQQDYPQETRKLAPGAEMESLAPFGDLRISCWTWIQLDPAYPDNLLVLVTDDGKLVLVHNKDEEFNVIQSLSIEDRTYEAQVFISGPYVWIALVQQSGQNGRHYIQLYRCNGVEVHMKQTISLDSQADIALIYNRGYWYMAVASHNKLTLFEWRETQFDEVASAPVFGLRSVTLWRKSGIIYIATAVSSGRSGSPLFSYNKREEGKLTRVEILPVRFANKVVKFTVDGNDYLLFVCKDFVSLYWWAGNLFLEYQIFENSAGALDASVLLLPNLEAAIAIAFKNEIRFYVEDFSSEYYEVFTTTVLVDLSHGFGFFHSNVHYFLFLTFDLTSWDTRPRALDETVPYFIWKLSITDYYDIQKEDQLSSCIDSMKKTLDANSRTLNHVEDKLDKVLVTNKEQNIQVPITVHGNVQVYEGLNVEHLILISSEKIPFVPQVTGSVLRDDLLTQERELNGLLPEMNGLLYKTQTQVINGDLIFLSPFKASTLQLPSLVNDVALNGIPVSVLAENTLQTHGTQTLLHNLLVTHIETQNLLLNGKINGISTQDVLLLNHDELIESELHFTNITVQDINLKDSGTVNGIKPSIFVIKNQPQVITGVKTFHNLIVQKDIVVHGQTNQHDLSVFVQNVVRLDQPDSIDWSNLDFAVPLIVDGDAYIEGLINGIVDLKELATKTLDLTSDQVIAGKKTFTAPVFVNGDVTVEGSTNGIDVSEQVLTLSTDQYIPGTTISSTIEVLGDMTTVTVNGYDLKKEVVLIQGPPQTIGGHKTFEQSIQVILDVDMRNGSTLNGLDLSELAHIASRMENTVFLGPTTFHSLVVQEVTTMDSINGIALDHLFSSVWRKSTDQKISVPVEFLQSVGVESDLDVSNSINGYDLNEDFVHTFGDEEISGYVRFIDEVQILDGLHVAPHKTINGFDVSDFNRSVVPSSQDTVIHNQVVFSSLQVKGNLIIDDTVDGTKLDGLLQADKTQIFTGHVTLSDQTVVSGDLSLDSLFLEKDINGVDFSEFNKIVLYDYDINPEELHIVDNKDFVGGLEVARLDSRGTVNGINLDNWYLNAVRLSTNDVIAGFNNFSKIELLGGFTAETLNDKPLTEHLSSVVLRTTDHIKGSKTIAGSVTVIGDLISKGSVNGVNLLLLNSEAVYSDSNNVFAGVVIVDGNLVLETLELGASSTIDGLLWNQLVFLDQNHALQGISSFHDEISTVDTTVRDTVNTCDIRRLANEAIYLDQPLPALSETMSARTLVVHGNMDTLGPVSGVDLKSFADGMLRRTGQQTITGQAHFTALQAENAELNVINDVNLATVIVDAVLKSKPQAITGRKHFLHEDGVTVLNDIHIMGDVVVGGTVSGVDLSELKEMAVLKTTEQRIEGLKFFSQVEVQGDIYIEGLLNGVSIPSHVILLETEEEIQAPLVLLADSQIAGHLYVGRHIDGVLFQQFVENRVTLLHDQEISAFVEFQDNLETDLLNVLGSVNGVPIADIVLQREGAHLLEQKIFENSITIQGSLDVHQLNGVDLLEFDRELVRINVPQEISTFVEFVTELDVQNDLLIQESVNDINIRGLEQEFASYHHGLEAQLQLLNQQINSLNNQVNQNQELLLARQFWDLLHFQPFQSLDVQLARLFPSPSPTVIVLEEDMAPGQIEKMLGWSFSCEASGCCSASSTTVFEVDGLGYLRKQQLETGLLFPLYAEAPLEDDHLHGFVLWTNSTPHNHMCAGHQLQTVSIVSVENAHGLTNIIELIHPVVSPAMQDARLIKTRAGLHLLITYSYNIFAGNATRSSLFRYNKMSSSWFLLQPLGGTDGTTSMDVSVYTDRVGLRHLVAALTDKHNLYVYRWTDMQLGLVANIPARNAIASVWIEASGDLYLLLSTVDDLTIYVYMPESVGGNHLSLVQRLDLSGITVLRGFKFSGESFVVAASQSTQELIILQWRGTEGFVPVQRYPVAGIRDVVSYWSTNRNLFLAVVTECGILVLKAVAIGFGQRH